MLVGKILLSRATGNAIPCANKQRIRWCNTVLDFHRGKPRGFSLLVKSQGSLISLGKNEAHHSSTIEMAHLKPCLWNTLDLASERNRDLSLPCAIGTMVRSFHERIGVTVFISRSLGRRTTTKRTKRSRHLLDGGSIGGFEF